MVHDQVVQDTDRNLDLDQDRDLDQDLDQKIKPCLNFIMHQNPQKSNLLKIAYFVYLLSSKLPPSLNNGKKEKRKVPSS